MCPAIAKTSDAEVVAAARAIVERDGMAALSMQSVAEAIGVRPPSLYKRFTDRAELLLAVEAQALEQLGAALERSSSKLPFARRPKAMALAYRRFARRHPRLYALLFSGATVGDRGATEARRRAVAPLLEVLSALLGPDRALPAARVLTAFLHGFVTMENVGEFRLGPGVDEAFNLGLTTLLDGLQRTPR